MFINDKSACIKLNSLIYCHTCVFVHIDHTHFHSLELSTSIFIILHLIIVILQRYKKLGPGVRVSPIPIPPSPTPTPTPHWLRVSHGIPHPPTNPIPGAQRAVARRPLRIDDRGLKRLAVRQEEQGQGAVAAAHVHHLGDGTTAPGEVFQPTEKVENWRSNREHMVGYG